MKILYVSQYYPPELCAPAARVSELSRIWAQCGHDVTVLTAFPHHPHGTKRPEDRRVIYRVESDAGVRVIRSCVYASPNSGIMKRSLSYVSFALSSCILGAFLRPKPDVVIATSPQLLTALTGRWLGFVLRAPFVFEVRDLWPESILATDALRDGPVIKILRGIARTLYRSATHIVTVGEGYRQRILTDYKVRPDKISVVTNGFDAALFKPNVDLGESWRKEHNLTGKMIILYLGTHGMAHGLRIILDCATELKGRPNLVFLFVGDGAEKAKLQGYAQELSLPNVVFLPPQSKEEVRRIYSASDMCLVPLRRADLFADVIPSKIFEIMAMAKPVIAAVNGQAKDIIHDNRAGLIVEPENTDAYIAAIKLLAADQDLRKAMGLRGHALVAAQFTRQALAEKYVRVLEGALGWRSQIEARGEAPMRRAG